MYGWRARIGAVLPSRGDTFMCEFYQIVPKGVVLVVSIIGLFNLTKEELGGAFLKYKEGAKELAKVGIDVLLIAGSPLFQLQGYGSDIEMINLIEMETGIPTTTSTVAEVEAMRVLNIRKPVIVSPFTDEVNERSRLWLQNSGFEVQKIKGLGIQKNSEIARLPFYVPYQLARDTFLETPSADGIFIACSRWATIGVIEKLEQDLGVPVVTSGQAHIWLPLRKANVREHTDGYGRLMRS